MDEEKEWVGGGREVSLPVNAVQLNDVRMVSERPKEHDLPECTLGVGLIAKCIENLLDGDR